MTDRILFPLVLAAWLFLVFSPTVGGSLARVALIVPPAKLVQLFSVNIDIFPTVLYFATNIHWGNLI